MRIIRRRKPQPVYMQYVEALIPLRYLKRRKHQTIFDQVVRAKKRKTPYQRFLHKYRKEIDVAYISIIVILSITVGILVGLSYPMLIHVFFK